MDVFVGSSLSNSKTVAIDAGSGNDYTCPSLVDENVWLNDDKYPDTYSINQTDSTVQIFRTDSNKGWGMNLKVKCCISGKL